MSSMSEMSMVDVGTELTADQYLDYAACMCRLLRCRQATVTKTFINRSGNSVVLFTVVGDVGVVAMARIAARRNFWYVLKWECDAQAHGDLLV